MTLHPESKLFGAVTALAAGPRLTRRLLVGMLVIHTAVVMYVGAVQSPVVHEPESLVAGLLAWYDYRISTGPLEGTNNKIRTMQRQAYGYRDKEFFKLKLKLYALHKSKVALVG